jgi:2-methylisocitrate lyase-like PEP mutase family enzyme
VSADFQAGYAAEPEGVAANVARCVGTGVAGLSIEDASGDEDAPLYPLERALERVRAARAAIDASGIPAVLTARCEAWLVGDRDPARTARERLVAFAEAGADCLFAPGVRDADTIAELVAAVAPKPLNVVMPGVVPGLTLGKLAQLGVRRVSLGSALSRVAWGAFLRTARELAESGSFDGLAGAAPFAEMNELFRGEG